MTNYQYYKLADDLTNAAGRIAIASMLMTMLFYILGMTEAISFTTINNLIMMSTVIMLNSALVLTVALIYRDYFSSGDLLRRRILAATFVLLAIPTIAKTSFAVGWMIF